MPLISGEGKRKFRTFGWWLIIWSISVFLSSVVTHTVFTWQTIAEEDFLGAITSLLSERSGATLEAIVIGFIAAVISYIICYKCLKSGNH